MLESAPLSDFQNVYNEISAEILKKKKYVENHIRGGEITNVKFQDLEQLDEELQRMGNINELNERKSDFEDAVMNDERIEEMDKLFGPSGELPILQLQDKFREYHQLCERTGSDIKEEKEKYTYGERKSYFIAYVIWMLGSLFGIYGLHWLYLDKETQWKKVIVFLVWSPFIQGLLCFVYLAVGFLTFGLGYLLFFCLCPVSIVWLNQLIDFLFIYRFINKMNRYLLPENGV